MYSRFTGYSRNIIRLANLLKSIWSPGVTARWLFQAQTVACNVQRPSDLFLKGYKNTVPVRGSLLHGYVTAISKSEPRIGQKPSSNRYNGTYGLQVWKVAQLVEQWIFNLCVPGSIPGFPICENNSNQADCSKHFRHIRHLAAVRCLFYGPLTQ